MAEVETLYAVPSVREVASPGWHDAVFVDYANVGVQWLHGEQLPCLQLYWQVAERNSQGYRFIVSKRVHKTVHRRSLLRQWLERLRGKTFPELEVATIGIMLEQWLDWPCRILIAHKAWRDHPQPWVSVTNLVRWDPTVNRFPLQPEHYRRLKDRQRDPWFKGPGAGKPPIL